MPLDLIALTSFVLFLSTQVGVPVLPALALAPHGPLGRIETLLLLAGVLALLALPVAQRLHETPRRRSKLEADPWVCPAFRQGA